MTKTSTNPTDSNASTDKIEIHINGRERSVPEGATISALLALFELAAATVVVELNGDILPRERYDEVSVTSGDQVEIVRFVGGGSR